MTAPVKVLGCRPFIDHCCPPRQGRRSKTTKEGNRESEGRRRRCDLWGFESRWRLLSSGMTHTNFLLRCQAKSSIHIQESAMGRARHARARVRESRDQTCASSPRAGLPQHPLAIRALGEAALFQCLKRGYGSIVDDSACRPDMLGDLGGRKGALLAEKSARFGNAECVGAKTRVLKYNIAPLTWSVAGPTTAIRNATLRTTS
jgi:hypothetical protein